MNFTEYQEQAAKTAIYPLSYSVIYPTLGLSTEVSELFEKYILRDDDNYDELIDELGDVCWYIAITCRDLGYNKIDNGFNHKFVSKPMNDLVVYSGKALSRITKAIRINNTNLPLDKKQQMYGYLIHCWACVEQLAIKFESDIVSVMKKNIKKLKERAENNNISGENR